jgi:hypothetical protein
MPTEANSIIYDLGQHILEITQEHTTLIAIHNTGNGPLSEIVQLDSDETYRLYIALKEMFQ